MTKPKRRRDGSGKFLPRGQVPGEDQRPDNPPSGGKEKPRPDAPRRCCEECGAEHRELRKGLAGGSTLFISYCERCCPDPLEALR